MASKNSINICIPKYFMGVRNCIKKQFFINKRYVPVDLFVYRQTT